LRAAYSETDFARIARALRVSRKIIRAFESKFEAAALILWLDRRSPKRTPPSRLGPKILKISGAARTLLRHLGVPTVADAPDGPVDREILGYLASASKAVPDGEAAVTTATARIGRLVEIIQSIRATIEIKKRASKAAKDVAKIGRLTVPQGHVGNEAETAWIDAMMTYYKKITGDEPATSVDPATNKAGGPLIRFLGAAGQPVGIRKSPAAWRSRVRAMLKPSPQQD